MNKRLPVLLLTAIVSVYGLCAATPWNEVPQPTVDSVSVTQEDPYRITVDITLPTGPTGYDTGEVLLTNSQGKLIDSRPVGRARSAQRSVQFTLDASGDYTLQVLGKRKTEEQPKASGLYQYDYTLPLLSPAVGVMNRGNGTLEVSFPPVDEATGYAVVLHDQEDQPIAMRVSDTATPMQFSGLAVGSLVTISATAWRGQEQSTPAILQKTVRQEPERQWQFTTFGQSSKAEVLNTMTMLDSDNLTFALASCTFDPKTGSIDSKGGKFTAFHDGISFYYTVIDGATENFELTGTFTIDYINPIADGQEGFGILALDSLGQDGVSGINHYTNSAAVLATKFEEVIGGTKKTSKDTLGSRFVTGITQEVIAGGDQMIAQEGTSLSRAFSYDQSELVRTGDVYTITLKKDNTGYHAIYRRPNTNEETIEEFILYGPEKLMVLDKNIYVGFAVARGCNATVSDVQLTITDTATDPPAVAEPDELIPLQVKVDSPSTYGETSYPFVFTANADGNLTVTDDNGKVLVANKEVHAFVDFTQNFKLEPGFNDYQVTFVPNPSYRPGAQQTMASYDRILKKYVESYAPATIMHTVILMGYEGKVLYASPNGSPFGNATQQDPLDIASAVAYVRPGQTIELAGGTYSLSRPLIIERGNNGKNNAPKTLRSAAGQRAILDFSMASGGMQLWGNWWIIEGMDIRRTIGNVKGLQVAGNDNIVRLVNAYECGDTGIQISGTSTETWEKWPRRNTIQGCVSHDNCDPAQNNADGFAAKLTCAEGNVFVNCIAYHNVDDGWDLFSKIESGPIGAVTIESCVAYGNGSLSDGSGDGDGNGFKMGGDGIAVEHVLRNSISYANGRSGITSNSNPALVLQQVTSYGNSGSNISLYGKGTGQRLFKATGVLSLEGGEADTIGEAQHVLSDDNYFFNGSVSKNASGDIFTLKMLQDTNLATPIAVAPDGTIEMHGLLQPNTQAPVGIGASIPMR